MTTRRFAAALFAAPLVLGLVACSSDDSGSESTSAGNSSNSSADSGDGTVDLSDVPVEEICTSLGIVYDWREEANGIATSYPEIRDYFAAESPAAIEAMNTAAEESPGDLADALTTLAGRTQTLLDEANATATETDYMMLVVTPDNDIDTAYVVINEFSDPQCGFTFTTA